MDKFKWLVVATGDAQRGREIKEQFERAFLLNPVHIIRNGDELVAYLSGTGIYHDRTKFPLPKVLLLDLQLPGAGPWNILKLIRESPELSRVSTVVLVTDETQHLVDQAYERCAKSYLRMPFTFAEFLERSRILGLNWILLGSQE
jgi:two-component system, response regulator